MLPDLQSYESANTPVQIIQNPCSVVSGTSHISQVEDGSAGHVPVTTAVGQNCTEWRYAC